MTGALDSEILPLAKELADEFGKAVTLVSVSETFDPATGNTTTTETTHLVNAVPPQAFNKSRIDGSLIQAGDTVIGLPAQPLSDPPTTEDKLRFDGGTWTVVAVDPIYSGEQVALYNVQVRQ